MSFLKSPGGVCAPAGFLAAGVAAGIKRGGGLDLAMLISDRACIAGGVFTKNRAAAAPVRVSRRRLEAGSPRGVVVNSGCANACTGEQGMRDATEMADLAGALTDAGPAGMLVCSTGLIGSHLPMEEVREGVKAAAKELGPTDKNASRALLTTDTRPKRAAYGNQNGWSIGGIAKGAGMIAPNMATMLAFITTDAVVGPNDLQAVLSDAVEDTFNAISIDGDTSTNDTVLIFANGASGMKADPQALESGLRLVCEDLSRMIVQDGEGITKLVIVRVEGAAGTAEARLAARAVAESTLVKTAAYGGDANWGRIVSAIGNSGAEFDLRRLSVSMGGVVLCRDGTAVGEEAVDRARAAMAGSEIEIVCDLAAGNATAKMLSTDLSPGYVELNAAYES